jgi:hypothetical protein
MRDSEGALKLIGESGIGHTPQGSDLSLRLGEAFDVTVKPTLDARTPVDKKHWRYAMSYVVANAKAEPVTVQLHQYAYPADLKVLTESLKSRRASASELVWEVPVPAEGETKLTFEVEEETR